MGRPLEFKRRVHLPADTLLEAPLKRSLNAGYAAVFAWLLLSGGTYFTLERWLVSESHRPTRSRSSSWGRARETVSVKSSGTLASTADTQVLLAPPAPAPAPEPEPASQLPIEAQSSSELGRSTHVLRGGLPEPSADEFIQTFSQTPAFDDEHELDAKDARVAKRKRRSEASRRRDFDTTPDVEAFSAERPPAPIASDDRPAPKVEEREQTPAQPGHWPAIEAGASCEGAVAKYREELNLERRNDPPDIGASAYSAILNDGSYFAHCAVPVSMRVSICAAVQHGRAIGVTVRTSPGSAGAERCIRGAVRRLRFPSHPKLDVTRTEFAPE